MLINKMKIFTDQRGDLFPIEFSGLPFEPKRIFTVMNVPAGSRRGEHAHYLTQQILICLKGRILVHLDYGEYHEEEIITEGESVLIKELIWDYQEFLTGQDILLVICSTHFNEEDYIRDYKKFINKS